MSKVSVHLNNITIKQVREGLQMSMRKFAKAVGIAYSSYNYKEHGTRTFTPAELKKVQKYINKVAPNSMLATNVNVPVVKEEDDWMSAYFTAEGLQELQRAQIL